MYFNPHTKAGNLLCHFALRARATVAPWCLNYMRINRSLKQDSMKSP